MFTYIRDPIFLIGCASYLLNRLWLKDHFQAALLHSWFNDFWLIPCALPPVLWLHRKLGLRNNDNFPTLTEIIAHVVFWSVLFEFLGPLIMQGTVADKWDIAAYFAGALLSWGWWHSRASRLYELR